MSKALYDLYVNVAKFFRDSPDTTGWPLNWQAAHEHDQEHAGYWQKRADALLRAAGILDEKGAGGDHD